MQRGTDMMNAKTAKLCGRCSKEPAREVFRAPCGCDNAYCAACVAKVDFQNWLKSYAKLHERVGGRWCGSGNPVPCPSGVEFQDDFRRTSKQGLNLLKGK